MEKHLESLPVIVMAGMGQDKHRKAPEHEIMS